MTFVQQVQALGFPQGSYAVFGSGPLAVRGIRAAADIDIIVTEALFGELAKDLSWQKRQLRDHHPALQRESVEVFCTWAPGSWDIDDLIAHAESIGGVPFVQLAAVIEWKQLRDSDKDKEDLVLIAAYQTAHQQ